MKSIGGLRDPDPATVGPALDALKAAGHDSDCNGITDIQQLNDGFDPNPPSEYIGNPTADGGVPVLPRIADAGASCTDAGAPDLPAFGCGAEIAPSMAGWDGAPVLAATLTAALGLAAARRRRR
jgi:hypothetical protein